VIAAIAGRQHGVVARRQLLDVGFTPDEVQGRLNRGHLHLIYRGVYAVGHEALSVRGRWMAAVLAGGADAVLSHRAAAALWELRPIPSGPIDVSAPGRSRRASKAGTQIEVRVHNVRALDSRDRAVVHGIPVTSVSRTLLDYAEVARPQQLRHALEAAERLDQLDGRAIDQLLARARGRRGVRVLREVIASVTGPAPWTQSELERRFLSLVRGAGIAEPHANVSVAGCVVDFFFPAPRPLVVEVDGYAFHKSRARFEDDRRRDAKLLMLGVPVIRVTQRRIADDPFGLADDLATLLSDAPPAAASGP
jgi:very-short-patch-repair endonuclease